MLESILIHIGDLGLQEHKYEGLIKLMTRAFFFPLSHPPFHLLKNKPINTAKKLILNCIQFLAENICFICVITNIFVLIHYFYSGYLNLTLLSPDPLKLITHSIHKHGTDKYAS